MVTQLLNFAMNFEIKEAIQRQHTMKGIVTIGDPGGPNSFNVMQFFGRIWQNRMLVYPPPFPEGQ